jgi:hypothetical protein
MIGREIRRIALASAGRLLSSVSDVGAHGTACFDGLTGCRRNGILLP